MIHETCICENVLREGGEGALRVRRSPCRCAMPGRGRSTLSRESFLDDISPKQYADRTRLGLPVVCEIEKSVFREGR